MEQIPETTRILERVPAHEGAEAAQIGECDERLISIYTYWNEKRGTRAMPGRPDIDPADLKAHLPLLCLIDVVPDARRYVYRLVGTREAEMRGRDPTGKAVAEAYYAERAGDTTDYLDRVLATGRPLLYRGTYHPLPTRTETGEVLFLPLSRDGHAVDMIMLYSHVLWLKDERRSPLVAMRRRA
ncbi:PAS domain-containing protein [Dongia mobilis]|uniref:PAS domain-containing protein n=1 Tax=Dongia mobilis TaxID=578943 RepID=A0A4R6WT69_9PROT|nr:PAS domain-containing protein [Dongia mobilis]TDQ82274.1 PAS domain-containing protein [Dongia mobilis]